MIAILSPAMNMRPCTMLGFPLTQPQFLSQARAIAEMLREEPPWALESLLRVNPDIALRAAQYYAAFGTQGTPSPALFAFHGLAYQSMAPQDFTQQDIAYAQDHVRMLSALYGLLRPLDGIHPYRLDFMGRVRVRGQSLYRLWGSRVCRALFEQDKTVLNLCSGEYARLITPHLRAGDRLVNVRFLTRRRGKLVCLATEAKICRGKMVRAIVHRRIDAPEALATVAIDGYAYCEARSGPDDLAFVQE